MERSNSYFLIKERTAKVVEIVACGGIIGAILALLLSVFVTGEASASPVEYAPVVGAVVGSLVTLAGGFIKNFNENRKALWALKQEVSRLTEEQRIPILVEALRHETTPVQIWAIRELGKIKDIQAISELNRLSNHRKGYIRRIAEEVLRERLNIKAMTTT